MVDFAFSEEQDQLRDAVRRFLEAKSPSAEVRRLMETDEGYDPAVWSQMANELGLQSLHIPEEYGGQGFTWVELGIVLEEMGAALLCAPYFSTVVLAAERDHERRDAGAAGGAAPWDRVRGDHRGARDHRAQWQVGRVRRRDRSRPARVMPSRSTARRAT